MGTVLLRAAAALLTDTDPADVVVDRRCRACGGHHGAPRLPATNLYASIAHSADLAVVALTSAGAVGVDVEAIRPVRFGATLSSVCSATERPFVRTESDFYRYWTRKEAILKATGEGLRRSPLDVVVSPPDRRPFLVAFRGLDPSAAGGFVLSDLEFDGYHGAVAVRAAGVSFLRRDAADLLPGAR